MIEPIEKYTQIGVIAKKLGITARTIHYYEEIGLMETPRTLGTRRYSQQDIARLKFIIRLKELNISLGEIKELVACYHENKRDTTLITPHTLNALDYHFNQIDKQISKLNSLRNDIITYRSRIVEILQKIAA